MAAVNYFRLAQAHNAWTSKGYRYVDVPYWVSKRAIEMTFPDDILPDWGRFPVEGTEHYHGEPQYLVGSAEQSFCQIMLDGNLPAGRYCAITPCFRDEIEDDLHHRHFMKLEIIDTTGDVGALSNILGYARDIFADLVNVGFDEPLPLKIIEYQGGYDYELDGVEIGSYGFREAEGFGWAYGTGLAEPRFSTALSWAFNNRRNTMLTAQAEEQSSSIE